MRKQTECALKLYWMDVSVHYDTGNALHKHILGVVVQYNSCVCVSGVSDCKRGSTGMYSTVGLVETV